MTGFRECNVADAENLAAWLAAHVCCREQRADRVREELLGQNPSQPINQAAATSAMLSAIQGAFTLAARR